MCNLSSTDGTGSEALKATGSVVADAEHVTNVPALFAQTVNSRVKALDAQIHKHRRVSMFHVNDIISQLQQESKCLECFFYICIYFISLVCSRDTLK